jgi:FAD/FMN-containing dehydrogenase
MAASLSAAAASSPLGVRRPPLRDSILMSIFDVDAAAQSARAIRRIDAALAATPFMSLPLSDRNYLDVATVYARAGLGGPAKAMLAQRSGEMRDTATLRSQEPLVHRVLGKIAIAENRARDAIQEFWKGDSLPDGPPDECDACTYVNLGASVPRRRTTTRCS